ncbi:MAG: MarC family protein [Planctomycetota bacterium]|nr:MarC family protein [Planctomycetota bacterium]
MSQPPTDVLSTFVIFFAVIDPVGTVPVFLAVTKEFDPPGQRRIAVIATLVSALVLLGFVVGELLLTSMSIPLSAFQVAGGLVMLLFALSMIFGESKPEEEVRLAKRHTDTAIFPLAIPSIAGPGSMLAAVLLTENTRYSLVEQMTTAAIMLLVLGVNLLMMLGATGIHRVLGSSGASVISRVMGLILSSVAVTSILSGIKAFFEL